ncbi:MAG TPA: DUF3795 domain-containing protein [Bacteroidales bacterium]
MKTELKRREFLTSCYQAGLACCALMVSPKIFASGNMNFLDEEEIDPKKLEYCGYKCPADCPLKKATVENNVELKKKAYETFKIKERHGVDFDPEKIFCWGCKVSDKPLGVVVKDCTVRSCVISKKLDCCIECDDLVSCNKKLWSDFPKFKDAMIEKQKKYRASKVKADKV